MRTEIITDSSSTASSPHTGMLWRPVKYAPVTRQNCLPQVVNRAMSASTASIRKALMAHAFATQMTESTITLPQSNDGVNISMPGSYLGARRGRRYTPTGSSSTRPSRHSPSPSSSSSCS